MNIGYARISKADGSQVLDLQVDALAELGIKEEHIYTDKISGAKDDRPGLEACLKALREGDTLVVWKLDRLGRSLRHLINTIDDLQKRDVGFKVLTGQGATIDTSTSEGRLMFSIFCSLAEFERDLIIERTRAGLKAARARGRVGGRKFQLTKTQVKYAQSAMSERETSVKEVCKGLGIAPQTLYRYVSPTGELRDYGVRVLAA